MVGFLQCNYGIWLWKTGLTSTAALPLLTLKPNLCCEEKHVSLQGYVQHLHSSYKIVNWGWRVGRWPSGMLGYILVGCCIRWLVNWLVLIILSCHLARVVIWLLVCLSYCCANTKIGNPGPVCGPCWAVLLQCTGSSESAHSQDLFHRMCSPTHWTESRSKAQFNLSTGEPRTVVSQGSWIWEVQSCQASNHSVFSWADQVLNQSASFDGRLSATDVTISERSSCHFNATATARFEPKILLLKCRWAGHLTPGCRWRRANTSFLFVSKHNVKAALPQLDLWNNPSTASG